MANPRKAHLLAFIQRGVNSHATGMWRNTKDKVNWDWTRPPYWQHMARTMERGVFDAIAVGTPSDIADQMAHYMDVGGADGFMLIATYTPGCFEEFVDLLNRRAA
jgi:alkanesulfonate monooxygenase SsuD/methylene tetrahydromethanopterin reductase-like flavin-dependent oxidoreductase (luciferase family)